MSTTVHINGTAVAVPEGACAYKYADPTEDAQWVYDADLAASIEREDAHLIVWAAEGSDA